MGFALSNLSQAGYDLVCMEEVSYLVSNNYNRKELCRIVVIDEYIGEVWVPPLMGIALYTW